MKKDYADESESDLEGFGPNHPAVKYHRLFHMALKREAAERAARCEAEWKLLRLAGYLKEKEVEYDGAGCDGEGTPDFDVAGFFNGAFKIIYGEQV